MDKHAGAELEISRFVLGTAQLGLNYGIANTVGQPSYETARDMIAATHEYGGNCLDTAAMYGSSEEVIGKALAELGLADKTVIVTKVTHMASGLTASEADRIVEESVTSSLRRLNLDQIPICLFHIQENFLEYSDSLLKLRDKGLARRIGSSVHSPAGAAEVVRSGFAEAVQIPSSVLDQRVIREGIVGEAAGAGVAVFIRSVFLQGLLLMPEEGVIPELAEVIPIRRNLRSLALDAGMPLAELAVRFMLGVDAELHLVLGAESVDQVRANAAITSKGPLEPTLHRAVCEAVPDLPDRILNPRMWSARMPDAKPVGRS